MFDDVFADESLPSLMDLIETEKIITIFDAGRWKDFTDGLYLRILFYMIITAIFILFIIFWYRKESS